MKYILRFILGVWAVIFITTTVGLAQVSDSSLDQTVIIQPNGRILIDGHRSRQIKFDILPDKYVWRYKAVDNPGRAIGEVKVTLRLPSTVTSDQVKPAILAVHGVTDYHWDMTDSSTIDFVAAGVGPEASITFTADLPKEAIHFTSWEALVVRTQLLSIEQWLVVATIMPAFMMLFSIGLFLSRSADIFLRPARQTQLTPPSQLPPALVGVLIHGYVGSREIAATLIDLARRGYIDIISSGDGDFGFSQKRIWRKDKQLHDFERFFLGQIFSEAAVSQATDINQKLNKGVWSDTVSQAIETIYKQMTELGYFAQNPKQAHLAIRFVGIVIFFVSVIGLGLSLLFFSDQPLSVLPWLATLTMSPLIARAALLVPRRTSAGRQQAALWLAFRQSVFLPRVVASYEAPTEAYESYLAYAIVLGAETQWTTRFSPIGCQLPDWFFSRDQLITTFPELVAALFPIIGFVGSRFSFSRKPTAL